MLVSEVWVEGYCVEEDEKECSKDEQLEEHVVEREPECSSSAAEEQDDAFRDVEREPEKRRGKANRKLGKRGEEAAARYLSFMDYQILERNWECPFGEADIIARDGDTLVFIEVKTRRNIRKGFPAEAVTPKKRAKYEKIAACYLRDYCSLDIPMRFDVIALLVVGPDRAMIKHYVDAFRFEH